MTTSMPVHACLVVCKHACTRVSVCKWRPEADIRGLSQSLSTIVSWIVQMSSSPPLPHYVREQLPVATPSFFHWRSHCSLCAYREHSATEPLADTHIFWVVGSLSTTVRFELNHGPRFVWLTIFSFDALFWVAPACHTHTLWSFWPVTIGAVNIWKSKIRIKMSLSRHHTSVFLTQF